VRIRIDYTLHVPLLLPRTIFPLAIYNGAIEQCNPLRQLPVEVIDPVSIRDPLFSIFHLEPCQSLDISPTLQ